MPDNLSNINDTASNAAVNTYTNAIGGSMQTGVVSSSSNNTNETTSIIGAFGSRENAEKAVNALRSQGFTSEEINIISPKTNESTTGNDEFYDDDISDGAMTGGAVGGLGGLLLSAGALAIPGVGPIVAAGPIAAALGGAVAGGITGGLIDWGIPAESGERYQQQVAAGNTLAIIRTTAAKEQQATQILEQYNARDIEKHQGK